MAPWVGCELSERLIVPFLEELSEDADPRVRRFCASLYRDVFSVVTTEVSESRLVSGIVIIIFYLLCFKWLIHTVKEIIAV